MNITGGKIIDSGGFGCIFKPAIPCEYEKIKKNNKLITKIMLKEHAVREHKKNIKIKSFVKSIPNWNNYFIFSNKICNPKKFSKKDLQNFNRKTCKSLVKKNITKKNINKNIDKVNIIQIYYGGKTLEKFIENDVNSKDSFKKINFKIIHLLYHAILPMNKKNLYHLDIKDLNILVDKKMNTRLIDFGLSSKIDNEIPNYLYNKPLQFNYPFTSIIMNQNFIEAINNFMNYNFENKNDLIYFIENYYFSEIVQKSGPGHYDYLRNVFANFQKKDLNKTIFGYIAEVIIKYQKDDKFDFEKYFFDLYFKLCDIWGFLSIYMSFVLKKNADKSFKSAIENILFKYLYNEPCKLINTSSLSKDLILLNNSSKITILSNKKVTKTLNTPNSIYE